MVAALEATCALESWIFSDSGSFENSSLNAKTQTMLTFLLVVFEATRDAIPCPDRAASVQSDLPAIKIKQ